MADQSLLMLARDVRAKTLRILEGVTEAQAMFHAPGLVNSILWHAGHSLWVVQQLALNPVGEAPTFPADWSEKFKGGSNPAAVQQWPKLAEVVAQLRSQGERLAAIIETLGEDKLAAIVGDPARNRTLRWGIVHSLQDEAGHVGEIWLLKKMLEKGAK